MMRRGGAFPLTTEVASLVNDRTFDNALMRPSVLWDVSMFAAPFVDIRDVLTKENDLL